MQYTFAAGIRILDTAVYSSLTDAQRAEARTLLFQAIQAVVGAMGVFSTETPLDFLKGQLSTKAGPDWGVGQALVAGVAYYIDPVTGRFVCERSYLLEQGGAEYTTTVQVGGQGLKSSFFIRQTALN